MKIYIVSCNPERVRRLTSASKQLNLDFEVVDAPIITDDEVKIRGKKAFEIDKSYPTGFAATLGHMRAMRKFVDSNKELCMIIEDDVRFHTNFNKVIPIIESYMSSNPANVFSLGFVNFPQFYNGKKIEFDLEINENVPLGNPWGCQCYMIKRSYAESFLDKFETGEVTDVYSNIFVTDWVIFDPVVGCCRTTLAKPIVIEDLTEASIAGTNGNKPDLLAVLNKSDFLF